MAMRKPDPLGPATCRHCGWVLTFRDERWKHLATDDPYCLDGVRLAIPVKDT